MTPTHLAIEAGFTLFGLTSIWVIVRDIARERRLIATILREQSKPFPRASGAPAPIDPDAHVPSNPAVESRMPRGGEVVTFPQPRSTVEAAGAEISNG